VAAPSLLTLDRGNTTLDCMLHGQPLRRQRFDPTQAQALRQFLGALRPACCVGTSVVPLGLDAAAMELAALGLRLLLAGTDLPCPLPLRYDTPATLGADRWLGALAAHRQHGAAVVVDCGSATTVNLVLGDGTFAGGAIAPGLRALQAGMAQVTPHLPPAVITEVAAMPPRSSAAAVNTGVVIGWCGAIERLVADLQRSAGEPVTVVLTGGNAELYLQHGRLQPLHVPDLVHQGLRLLAETTACGS